MKLSPKEAVLAVALGVYMWQPSFATAFGFLIAYAALELSKHFAKPDIKVSALEQKLMQLNADLEDTKNKVSALSIKAATSTGWTKRG